ncbi:unnamed protein product [Brassicogethes aeneus]|uniref:Palmitoyltransferase n=1 Tax=Brassicogethes aeneus TaxID=1431903 RepID=A0A9P0B9Y7_BRAAE|nr:unnamed protein product [Brassicogethes aeneus]
MTQGKITRKWEAFPGQNRFYCNGRLMTAPHSGVFLLTVFLITGTSALFFIFDCKYLAENVTVAIPIIGAVLFIFTMSSLLRTSLTDPGIIPRATNEEANYVEKQIEVTNSANSPTYRPPPRTKEVLVKGQTIKLKYCFTCKIFRPPRASHCSLCDNCVDRFDHHCPWVGNCVGRRNYRFFYMFIVSLAFLAVFIFACAIAHLILISKEDSRQFLDAVKESPPSIIVALICFFSVWSILGLAGFHTYLTTSNQTTNEDIKGSFTSKRGQESFNPYSQGNVCSNCFHILCGPLTPSLIDRRGLLTESYMAELARPITTEPVLPMKPYPIQNMNGPTHITMNANEMPGIYRQTTETTESNAGSVTHLVSSEQPLAIASTVHQMSLAQQQQYKSQPSLNLGRAHHAHHHHYHNVTSSSASAAGGSSPPPPPRVHKSQSLADNLNSEDLHLDAVVLGQQNKFVGSSRLDNDMTVQDRENSLLSANRLRLLQDTTMIESALDLDSLDDSSLGTNSQNGLMKVMV